MTCAVEEQELMDTLLHHRLLIASGVPGIYGRGAVFEKILHKLDQAIHALVEHQHAEAVHFPPVLPRRVLERTEYLESFPQLCGCVFSFMGDDSQHRALVDRVRKGEAWAEFESMTDVVLTPAACYPLYPTCTGTLPSRGRLFDLTSYCFRHEPSLDPARMQMFRMRELVRLGEPEEVWNWRQAWIDRGLTFLHTLGIEARAMPASDPFFGRAGRMLAANQRDQELKHELVFPICSVEKPTALMSLNYHQEHFGMLFDIRTHDGASAHTSCLGFGLERIVIALFKTHGVIPDEWPSTVRSQLWT